jgi:hypothetical protein
MKNMMAANPKNKCPVLIGKFRNGMIRPQLNGISTSNTSIAIDDSVATISLYGGGFAFKRDHPNCVLSLSSFLIVPISHRPDVFGKAITKFNNSLQWWVSF